MQEDEMYPIAEKQCPPKKLSHRYFHVYDWLGVGWDVSEWALPVTLAFHGNGFSINFFCLFVDCGMCITRRA